MKLQALATLTLATSAALCLPAAAQQAKFDTFALETIPWTPDQIRENALAKGKVDEELVKRKNISLG